MDVETVDLYECYFKKQERKIFLSELYEHHCRFCSPLTLVFKMKNVKQK